MGCLGAHSPRTEPAHQSDAGAAFQECSDCLLLCHPLYHPAPAHGARSVSSELRGVGAGASHGLCSQTDRLIPCQLRKLRRNRSPTPGTSRSHTGPTVQWPRSADPDYPNRAAQVCWGWSWVMLMYRNKRLRNHLTVLLCMLFSPMWSWGEGGWQAEVTEDRRAAYRSLTQKKRD